MAFDISNLALMATGNGKNIYHYTTTDTAATVDTVGYFNEAINQLGVGDFIFLNVDTGGTPAYGIVVVNQNDGTNVDVADMTQIGATDTD